MSRDLQASDPAALVAEFDRQQQSKLGLMRRIKQELRQRYEPDAAAARFVDLFAGRLAPPERLRLRQLARFCRRVGAIRTMFFDRETFEISGPRQAGQPPPEALPLRSRRFFLACLEDASVSGRSSLIRVGDVVLVDQQGREGEQIEVDFDFDPVVFHESQSWLWTVFPAQTDHMAEAFSLLGCTSHAFGHLIAEYLPQLSAALRGGLPAGVPILIDAGMPSSHLEAISIVVAGRHPVVELPFYRQLRVQRLWRCSSPSYVPLMPRVGQPLGPEFLSAPPQYLARECGYIGAAFGTAAQIPGRRIFLARKPDLHRKLVNAGEIERLLRARGFEVFYPEERNFAEQVALLRSATQIVGPEGSATLLGIFAQPGTRLCMLNHPFIENLPSYCSTLEAIGVEAWMLIGECVQEHPQYRKFSDYRIEPDALIALLDQWESSPAG